MAKYEYDVYELGDKYETYTISNTEKTEYFKKYTKQIQVLNFYSGSGTFSTRTVDVANSKGYYYQIDGEYYQIYDSFFSAGGSQGYGYIKLRKIGIKKKQVKYFIETIIADENAYPTNGIKDGKWYVRKEIIQEHKISLKDSEGKLINIASIYFKDSNSNISNIAKAYSDKELLWEKNEDTIVYSESGKSSYDININSWTKIKPDTNYKFVTNRADNEYSIVAGNTVRKIKNNDVFKCKNSVVVKIRNTDYNYFDIKLIKTKEPASVIL